MESCIDYGKIMVLPRFKDQNMEIMDLSLNYGETMVRPWNHVLTMIKPWIDYD